MPHFFFLFARFLLIYGSVKETNEERAHVNMNMAWQDRKGQYIFLSQLEESSNLHNI
jgi:hypothetical protein